MSPKTQKANPFSPWEKVRMREISLEIWKPISPKTEKYTLTLTLSQRERGFLVSVFGFVYRNEPRNGNWQTKK